MPPTTTMAVVSGEGAGIFIIFIFKIMGALAVFGNVRHRNRTILGGVAHVGMQSY